jgi:hypothetical protein
MTEHYIEKCKHCKNVINQCRCSSPNKTVRWGVCSNCKGKEVKEEAKGDPRTDLNMEVTTYCAWCKKYMYGPKNVEYQRGSHAICPECLQKFFGEYCDKLKAMGVVESTDTFKDFLAKKLLGVRK